MRYQAGHMFACIGFSLVVTGSLCGGPVMAQSQTRSHSTGVFSASSSSGELLMVSQPGGVRIDRLRLETLETPLQAGDVVSRVDGLTVVTPEDILGYVRQRPQLGALSLSVRRGADQINLTIEADLFRAFMAPEPPAPPAPPG